MTIVWIEYETIMDEMIVWHRDFKCRSHQCCFLSRLTLRLIHQTENRIISS